MERLQKVMAHAGVASRRECETLIKNGRVKVNGKKVTEMGVQVDPSADVIVVDGEPIAGESKVYLLLNKPSGYVTTVKDPEGRPTVLDLVKVPQRVYPVGRLDYDTEGLLILTNDGSLTYQLTHPKHEVNKTYQALVRGTPSERQLNQLRRGVELEDGLTAPAAVKCLKKVQGSTLLEIVIHEGRNRQVRRMCDCIGHPVLELKRTGIGKLRLGKLPAGHFINISKKRIEQALN